MKQRGMGEELGDDEIGAADGCALGDPVLEEEGIGGVGSQSASAFVIELVGGLAKEKALGGL